MPGDEAELVSESRDHQQKQPAMNDKIRVAVNGAGGRMGRRIVALVSQDADLKLDCAIEAASSPLLGQDAGTLAGVGESGVKVAAALGHKVDVVIDFSMPQGLLSIAKICGERGIPLVGATTGLSAKERDEILSISQVTPLLLAPSMSLAVNLAMKLVREAARALKSLPDGVDVEIIERHHRFKEDAPSGTALQFGKIVSEELGITKHQHGREGRTGKRPRNEIGYHALRTGDNVGEHTIVFGLMGETLEVYVRGHTRDSYAFGAVAAAKFLAKQKPGLYTMADVLGL